MTQRVQAVERALALLEAIADSPSPPTVPELARSAGVNRATAWRLMNTLEHFDLAVRDEQSGRYRLGHGVLRLATAADGRHLAVRLRPLLDEASARTGGSAYLEVATRGQLVVLAESRAAGLVHVDLGGLAVPLHCGSVGKVYLASWDPAALDAFLAGPLSADSWATITDPEELRAQIEAARQTGYATQYGEHRAEWCGITAAVRDGLDRDIAYVNITLPTYSITPQQLQDLAPTMLDIAGRMGLEVTRSNSRT